MGGWPGGRNTAGRDQHRGLTLFIPMHAWSIGLMLAGGLLAGWIVWRLASRRAVLPCPAEFDWLVETENPIARATRSERVVRLLAPRPGARVADLGCGPGRVALPLARAVGTTGELIAVDVQGAMLAKVEAKAKAAGLANVRLVRAELNRGFVADGSLDGAVLVMALGEMPERDAVLPAVFAALRPGGRLVVAESVFDPHYIPRGKLRAVARAAGFIEGGQDGNAIGYGLLFEKPAAA